MARSIREIQTALKTLGLYKGNVDGSYGPQSKAAARAFQRLHGLEPDGLVGPLTEAALFPPPIPDRTNTPLTPVPPPAKATVWPKESECPKFYGAVGVNQKTLILPFRMKIAWDLRKSIDRFSVHAKVHDSAARAFERIATKFNASQRAALGIDLFGGCLNVRNMVGGTRPSMHSWGIAIDFDPTRNQLKWGREKARLGQKDAIPFWEIWEDEGWVSLGRALNYDWMHVQAARR